MKYLLHEYSKKNSKKDNNINKWHKTGDAGRICNNTLYYFGRNDKKVKGVYNSIIEQDLCVTFHNIKKVGVVYHKEELYIFVNYVIFVAYFFTKFFLYFFYQNIF